MARVALHYTLRGELDDFLDCPNFACVFAAKLAGKPLEEAHHAELDRPVAPVSSTDRILGT